MKIYISIILILITVQLRAQSNYKRITHFVLDATIGAGTEYETPYYILRTEKEYPKILIDAGIHGDEVAGIYAIDTVMKYINVREGTVAFIPKVNIQAYRNNTRGMGEDLNQVFPGNKDGKIYEERLAYEFMKFVEEFRPDVVINLHEAWTKFDENWYNKKKDKSFGQTLITNSEDPPRFLKNALNRINYNITNEEYKFRIQYFPFKPNHSMDNIIDKLKIPSYTVETLRILPLQERINYQIYCILSFIDEAGIIFDYDPAW